MQLSLELTSRSYAIEIDVDRFRDLMDSESYVTGNATAIPGVASLYDRLNALMGITGIEYDAHFGAFVYFSIEVKDDTPELHKKIIDIIEAHLVWCASLEKRADVVARRATEDA